MNLHHDREVFQELIVGAANELAIPTSVIEKDYYVTITLRALSERLDDMVFKGGTSLTKCYQLLDRFSEDIDLSYTAEAGVPGEARKRKLKKAVVSTMEEFGFTITNLDTTVKLIPEVRAVRAELTICPSAKEDVCITNILKEIVDSQVYKNDYEEITLGLLFVPETYDTVIQSIRQLAESGIWN